MKTRTKLGREVEIEHSKGIIYNWSLNKEDDTPRQNISVQLIVDGKYYFGDAILNPKDVYNEDIGLRTAFSHAMAGGGEWDAPELSREDRADIWEAIHKLLLAEKCVAGIKVVEQFDKKYGQEELERLTGLPTEQKAIEETAKEYGFASDEEAGKVERLLESIFGPGAVFKIDYNSPFNLDDIVIR